MKIKSIKNGVCRRGRQYVMGFRPIGFDAAAAEAEVECDDGAILYIAESWFSEEPDILSRHISTSPNLDILLYRGKYKEFAAAEYDDEEDFLFGFEIADLKEFTGEVRISDDDMENLLNDLRLSVIACINAEEPFHGQFSEDAFTDGWHYEE